jgi:cytidine deaminase
VLTYAGNLYRNMAVRNASYPLNVCAERVAVYQAVAAGDSDIEAVAVVTENGG